VANFPVTNKPQVLNLTSCGLTYHVFFHIVVYIEGETMYNDGVLAAPISIGVTTTNSFDLQPALVMDSISTEGVDIIFSPKRPGKAWAVILHADGRQVSSYQVKTGEHAIGSTSFCRMLNHSITEGQQLFSFQNCSLVVGKTYKIHVYIETETANMDGALSRALHFTTPASNAFVMQPTLLVDPTPEVVVIRFSVSQVPAMIWSILVVADGSVSPSIASVKLGSDGIGGPGCRRIGTSILASVQTLTLNDCQLSSDALYQVLVYVEKSIGNTQGILSDPLAVWVPKSNVFVHSPALFGTVTRAGFKVRYSAKQNLGRAWGIVVEEQAADMVTAQSVRNLSSAVGGVGCMYQEVPITDLEQVWAFSDCAFKARTLYLAFVYVEDTDGDGDGTLSQPIVLSIPPSNYFIADPTMFSSPTSDSVVLNFACSASQGKLWALIVHRHVASKVTVANVKSFPSAVGQTSCRKSNMLIDGTIQSLVLNDCDLALQGLASYAALVYVEDSNGANDGQLSAQIYIDVERSNAFDMTPQFLSTPSLAKLKVEFQCRVPAGRAWVIVLPEAGYQKPKAESVKHAVGALGGAACQLINLPISGGLQNLELQNCGLTYLTLYRIVVYVEGPAPCLDGSVGSSLIFKIELSNTFDLDPALATAPSSSTVEIVFTPAKSGFAWALVSEDGEANHTAASLRLKLQTGGFDSVNATCRLNSIGIEPREQFFQLQNCSLAPGSTYALFVYVEDTLGKGDGSWSAALPFMVGSAPQLRSNRFSVYPSLSGAVTPQQISLMFETTGNGTAFGLIVRSGLDNVTVVDVMSGDGLCSVVRAVTAGSLKTLSFPGCSVLAKGKSYRAFVYVTMDAGNMDGTLSNALDFSVPPSNKFDVGPLLDGMPGLDGINVTIKTNASGYVWISVFKLGVGPNLSSWDPRSPGSAQATCSVQQRSLDASLQSISMTSCDLTPGLTYHALVYVEDTNGLGDGLAAEIVPITVAHSNSFEVLPRLVKTPTISEVIVEFVSKFNGVAWARIFDKNVTSVTIGKIKTASGSDSTCEVEAVGIQAHGKTTLHIADCLLDEGLVHHVWVYIEDFQGQGDGMMQEIDVIVPTADLDNQFIVTPHIKSRHGCEGATISFTTGNSGKAWVAVVEEAALAKLTNHGLTSGQYLAETTLSIESIKKTENISETQRCSLSSLAVAGSQESEAVLLGCSLEINKKYLGFVYVEGSSAGQGQMSAGFTLSSDQSSTFVETPSLHGSARTNEVTIRFKAQAPHGKAWVKLVKESEATSITSDAKAMSKAVGEKTCHKEGIAINDQLQDVILHGCSLFQDVEYRAVVYVEAAKQSDDGSVAEIRQVQISPVQKSNSFARTPVIKGTATADGFALSFTASGHEGRVWAMVVPAANAGSVSVEDVLAGTNAVGGSSCRHTAVFVNASVQTFAFRSCALTTDRDFFAVTYVEDLGLNGDGTLAQTKIIIPVSNNFREVPKLKSTPVPDGVKIQFAGMATDGKAWCLLVAETDVSSVTIASVKAGQDAVGGSSCLRRNIHVSNATQAWYLSGCRLSLGEQYRAFVYLEDPNGQNDGVLSALEITVASGIANGFASTPEFLSPLTESGTTVGFQPLKAGKAWGMIMVESNHAPAISSVIHADSAYAEGDLACRHIAEDVDDDPQVWAFTDCRLTFGKKYVVVIYVTGKHGNEPGTFKLTDVRLATKVSNFFSSLPMIVGTATSSGIQIELKSMVAGKLWIMISSKPNNVTISSIEQGSGAIGSLPCLRNGVSISSEKHSVVLQSCDLVSGPKYFLYGYVTGDRADDYGSLSRGISFVVPPSNRFVQYPSIFGLATPEGLTVRFTPRASGKAWVVLLEGSTDLGYGIANIKQAVKAIQSPSCIRLNETIFTGTEHSIVLSGCGMDAGMTHELFVYIEDHGNRGDGTISGPINVNVGVSNRFQVYPKVLGTPMGNNVTMTFRGSLKNGTAWAIIVAEENARSVNISTIKEGANAVGGPPCVFSAFDIDDKNQVVTFLNCHLEAKSYYKGFVYIEDSKNNDDGTLSNGVDIFIVSSNQFITMPSLASEITTSTFNISFQGSAASGKSWIAVYTSAVASSMSVTEIKSQSNAYGSASCRVQGALIDNTASTFTLDGCRLAIAVNYNVFVYIEGIDGHNDGTLSDAVLVQVKTSNNFGLLPLLMATASSDGLPVVFAPLNHGKSWAFVVQAIYAASVNVQNVKSFSMKQGSASCSNLGVNVTGAKENTLHFSQCSLSPAQRYRVFVYIESNAGLGDGALEAVDVIVPMASASNDFSLAPRLKQFSCDGAIINFQSSSPGIAWALIVDASNVPALTSSAVASGQYMSSQGITIGSIKALEGALGGTFCMRNAAEVDAGMNTWHLMGCGLTAGTEYWAFVYIEGISGLGVMSPPIVVLPPFSNTFTEMPQLTGEANGDGGTISFRTSAPLGRAWAFIIREEDQLNVTVDIAKNGQLAVGGDECRRLGVIIDDTSQVCC
jgi:hypothetical protein